MRYIENIDTPSPLSVIGLGTWQFGSREWGYGGGYDDADAGDIVARARELGVTVYDTAEIYGNGRSETILGKALAATGGADGLAVASKLFPLLPVDRVVRRHGVRSAERLGLETIGLYQVHQPNPIVRDGPTMRGMRALRDAGVIREVGVSNYSLARWQTAERRLGSRVLSNPGAVQPCAAQADGQRDAALGPADRPYRDRPTARSPKACSRAGMTATTARRTAYGR